MAMVKKIDPFEQGFEASANEATEEANPYAPGTAAYAEWLEGWRDGEAAWNALAATRKAA